MKIRPTQSFDIPGLQKLLDSIELFPGAMLPQMVQSFLSEDDCAEIWLTSELNGKAVGFCYAAPEAQTDGTWNMLAIGVLDCQQGKGVGSAIVEHLEKHLREEGQRLLIVDTSGTDGYLQAREFYRNNGYHEEARIRDFWAAGDDKVVFRKSL